MAIPQRELEILACVNLASLYVVAVRKKGRRGEVRQAGQGEAREREGIMTWRRRRLQSEPLNIKVCSVLLSANFLLNGWFKVSDVVRANRTESTQSC